MKIMVNIGMENAVMLVNLNIESQHKNEIKIL